tara:strand:- start:661 stop:822 length:162 start_codon:yes stop_codon:yes gene_type:complete
MFLINKLRCMLKLNKCDLGLVEIYPMDMIKRQTKRIFRCSNCNKVRYKIDVAE